MRTAVSSFSTLVLLIFAWLGQETEAAAQGKAARSGTRYIDKLEKTIVEEGEAFVPKLDEAIEQLYTWLLQRRADPVS
jgi:hypothetical protein